MTTIRPRGPSWPSERIPEKAFQARRLAAYDAALRGRVEYPPAFWETGSIGP